ncbi:hypothetical protein CRM94_22350 [Burkholderia gladioli]|uniref:Uncharacterized protein n=1 Tax=Burkholderia gladioli TaxID=28095 RepID=A0A2A7S223_BURGA|nr:hypothetical protein [Burkholderia gladioli]PEH37290.1 hypothetical protein CRM94_22350 [Burkholderia gladioli]
MKLTDSHTDARHDWLDNEQAPRVIASDVARQSNFEKSTIVRVAVVAILLIVAADLAQEAPTKAQPAARHLTA